MKMMRISEDKELGMAVAFNPSTWELEVVGSLWVQGQRSLQREF